MRRRGEAHPSARTQQTLARTGRERERGPLQDHALYTCRCGYVFEAIVSTTVGCPNCGGEQAW